MVLTSRTRFSDKKAEISDKVWEPERTKQSYSPWCLRGHTSGLKVCNPSHVRFEDKAIRFAFFPQNPAQ